MAGKKTLLRDVNPHLICPLCRGYLIDATTVVECLHSFCRSCILKHLRYAAHCPSCKHVLNTAKPNIKADKALQDIVYKLVPGLYHKEMLRRREFYKKHPEHANSATPEQRGEDVSGRLIFSPEDVVSLSLEYSPRRTQAINWIATRPWLTFSGDTGANNLDSTNSSSNKYNNNNNHDGNTANNRRYLQCPALVTVAHLKKFIALKYSIDVTRYNIEITHRYAALPENWTLIDVAYIYPWKRNAPMRLFYRVAKEQRLEAPLHQRPSTPGLGARECLPPNDTQDGSNITNSINNPEIFKSEVKSDSNSKDTSVTKEESNKTANVKVHSPVGCEQTTTVEKNEANETATTKTNTSSLSTTACNDSNKQIKKSPIKILKNLDGKYEVQKNSSATVSCNEKEQAIVATDTKNLANPEFSVVNSNGVKITLKQCSPPQNDNTKPPQNDNTKKPKIISNVLLSRNPLEKDALPLITLQSQEQQGKGKSKVVSPVSSNKQEKQRRKVTFVDRLPMSEKASPSTAMPKTALKRPAEQQDKKQFLQGFQLTAREPSMSDDSKAKSPVRDAAATLDKFLQKTNAMPKMEEFSKKNTDKNNENVGSKTNNTTAANVIREHVTEGMMSAFNPRICINKIDSVDGHTFSAGTNPNSKNIVSGNHATKLDVYTFSNDPPILPAGAVKRKCPPGVPIADLKRRKSMHIATRQNASKKQNISLHNSIVKQSHISSMEHVVPTSRTVNIAGDHGGGGVSHMSNANNGKTSTNQLSSNDTRDFLVDGYGLNIPASLSITLTSPKSSGTSKQFIEPNDPNDNNRKVALGKVNPTITLNNKSVDPRVLKALKTGQIKMPATPPKAKPATMAATMDRNEATNQQRTAGRQKREHDSSREILDLSGGNKKVEIHPLRIPQPVAKLNKTKLNKDVAGRNSMQPGSISDQGQVVTLLGGHRYYRAPPGSLTPAAHRVNDCPPLPSRTPVYAPSFASIGRSNSDLSSVFPSLPSLYALHQAPNLQQFQMDAARLRLSPRSTTESGGNANPGISGISVKTHLAAQCAPIKPARNSVTPLAVPMPNKPPIAFVNKPASMNSNNCTVQGNVNKPVFLNKGLDPTGEVSQATIQRSFSLNIKSTNKFPSPCKITKSNDKATVEIKNKDLNVETRNESNDIDNSMQQQQHREAASPSIVSSTASPSPPPGNGGINARNEDSISRSDVVENINNASGSNSGTTTPSPTKSNIASEVTCSKAPDSPDSSSITVESSGTNKNCSTDREMPIDCQIVSDATKTSDSHDSSVDNSTTLDDKSKSPSKSETNEITKPLTSEMVQKRLLAVFPTNEWANNPIAAEHLGNFIKSLNATMKSEEHAEGSKAEKIDRKPGDGTKNDNDASAKSKKDVVEGL